MQKVFFFTDIHGMWGLYKSIIDFCISQDPNCIIVYGGDACDRGVAGYRIIKDLLNNPNIIYLKGNHEDLFVKSMQAIAGYHSETIEEAMYDGGDVDLQIWNGGWSTINDWMKDGKPIDLIEKLNSLPLVTSIHNFDFCHAGGNPKVFQRLMTSEETVADEEDIDHVLWDRNCLGLGWTPGRICAYGHTPTITLPSKYYCLDKSIENAHPCIYTGTLNEKLTGKKINMDTCACSSGRAYVLDCNTLEVHGFLDLDIVNNEKHEHKIEKIEVIQL